MQFKSTMGAPLTDDETNRVKDAWDNLRGQVFNAYSMAEAEPVEMLPIMTETILKIYEVRRAIDEGWFQANRRAFPTTTRGSPPRANSLARVTRDLAALDITAEQLTEFLKQQND